MSSEASWLHSNSSSIESICAAYDELGVVAVTGLLSAQEIAALRAADAEGVASGALAQASDQIPDNDDVIIRQPAFAPWVRDARLLRIVRPILGRGIELQHAKFNAKPTSGGGAVNWHQDFPFYPHTNYDLVSATIYFDDTDATNGAVRFIPGSHKGGVVPHCDEDGTFVYGCVDQAACDAQRSIAVEVPAGTVSFHHCLAVHGSGPVTSQRVRRLLIFQYRAEDAVQLAGAVWGCAGMDIAREDPIRRARFPDGTTIILRGRGGRLYDVTGSLKPDKVLPAARARMGART
jgi:ectoine hydroxylase-related dioxygenase (phytanoyl-CoA dioxygenase family)